MHRLEEQSHDNTWHNLRHLKTPHLKEHASLNVSCHTEARPSTRIALHVSSFVTNHTQHNPETIMTNARLYTWFCFTLKVLFILHNILYTLLLNSITDLSVEVLTCLRKPFVPPRKLITTVLKHFPPTLPLIHPHRTDHIALEEGDRSLTVTV